MINKIIGPQNDSFLQGEDGVVASKEEINIYKNDCPEYDIGNYEFTEGHCRGCEFLTTCAAKVKNI